MATRATLLLLCGAAPAAAFLCGALRHGAGRTVPLRMCSAESAAGKLTLVDADTISRIRNELWRASDADPVALEKETRETLVMLMDKMVEDNPTAAVPSNSGAGKLGESATASLNALVAPHLPMLLGRNFPTVAREVMLAQVKTEPQRAALLQLSQFVVGVQEEVADALSTLQWRQQEKLRDLCDAASDGGTSRLIEMAEAMKEELDTDFCNYLNFAIEQAEAELRGAGLDPYLPPHLASAQSAALEGEGSSVAGSGTWSSTPVADSNLSPLHPDREGEPPAPKPKPAKEAAGTGRTPERQQWLLVLRLVRQGVYSMLAKEYDSDVKHIRYILALNSADSRQQLTHRTLLSMNLEQQEHFKTTLGRIVDNLSVQRNARDVQLHAQAVEVQGFVEEYGRDYGGIGGDFATV